MDWRGSIKFPEFNNKMYTLDDVAQYDYPAAVEKIIKVTGHNDIQVKSEGFTHFHIASTLFVQLIYYSMNIAVSEQGWGVI